ncbi:MAG TPA: orotidine-5'-phosphate decarboxylase [Candidatus Saccharimonadales bacterium]|nr:orotidine-5'-phosphate decarboxylase [Candidatus Saccharimonadales bacterium]
MNFADKLNSAIKKNNSLLCVGLDPDFDKLPEFIKSKTNPQFEFNKAIIDSTHDLVCIYKPNPAFYESLGDGGVRELKMTCDYIRETYPEIPVLVDAKRGDIGNTNNGYVQYAFDYLQADAMTVMPYLGIESLDPYFERSEKGIVVGCHSSNPGAKEFQELDINGKQLYEIVAEELVKKHGDNPNCMIFMGATFPEQLTNIRKIIGDMTILAPGVGAQGATVEMFVKSGMNSQKAGLIINASRSIIFASAGEDFTEKAREEAIKLRDEINKFRV